MLKNILDFMRGIEKLKRQNWKTVVNVFLLVFFPIVQIQLTENILKKNKTKLPSKSRWTHGKKNGRSK